MKKIFTLILIAPVAVAAIARDKAPTTIMQASEEIKALPAAKPAAVTPIDEYESLGIGQMTDDMVTAWYQYSPVTYEVEIMQAADKSPRYRVITPYGQAFADAMKGVNGVSLLPGEYDYAGTTYLDIDASDPDDVYFAKTMIGCDWGEGEMYIGIPSSSHVTFKNGVFSAPVRGVAVGDDTGAVAMNTHGKFRIVLPGITPDDYNLELAVACNCVTSRSIKGTIAVGDDIATVNYGLFENILEDEMTSYVNEVAELGTPFEHRGDFEIEMPETSKATLVLAGLNSDGECVAFDWETVYFIATDSSSWEDVGEAEFTDGFLPTFYQLEPETMKCRLERNKADYGMLRLVSPYATHPTWTKYAAGHFDHPHYIYINATDKECIHLEESPICLDFGHGMVRVNSFVNYFLACGYDIEECKELELGAIITNNVMTFPAEALIVSMLEYDNADWYTADDEGVTTIKFPEGFDINAGVDDILTDGPTTADPVYFNMQGIRVASPQEGQLYIKVAGNEATKVVF